MHAAKRYMDYIYNTRFIFFVRIVKSVKGGRRYMYLLNKSFKFLLFNRTFDSFLVILMILITIIILLTGSFSLFVVSFICYIQYWSIQQFSLKKKQVIKSGNACIKLPRVKICSERTDFSTCSTIN